MSDQQLAKFQADIGRYQKELENCKNLKNTKECAEEYVAHVKGAKEPLQAELAPGEVNPWLAKPGDGCSLL